METKGLSSEQAKKLLTKHGPNKLPEKPPSSDLSILFAQLKSPLVYVLIAAALVTFLLGHYTDTAVILIAVVVNTILGFIQERRASNALSALKKLIHPTAIVIRDGKQQNIDVGEIVPGDVCILNTGDKVPADGKIIKANRLYINEAILTGESALVEKKVYKLKAVDYKKTKLSKDNDPSIITSLGFMGTIVSGGRGVLVVEKTGEDTEVGKIAERIQEIDAITPLQKQISDFSKKLSILVLILIAFVFLMGVVSGRDISQIFTTSVALAVSAIPEGLLVGLTVVLAIGMQRILKRKGLVRSLLSAETLGGVTTICVDKTGTLTKGEMTLTGTIGSTSLLAKQALIANDLDDPMLITARDWALKKVKSKYVDNYERLDSLPFSSRDRFFASLNDTGIKNTIYVNGAPEVLLKASTLSEKERLKIEKKIEKLTKSGARVFAMATKSVSASKRKISKSDIKKLKWVGVLGFSDPVRKGVKSALGRTKRAGLNMIVITGDYAQTAVSVLSRLGIKISESEIMHGSELAKTPDRGLRKKLVGKGRIKLFARTTPDQKLKIVEALKANGEVVAMMGDGVNDAPALNRADIGIVVGDATDVAKESADLVLLDSSFSTIVSAIEEGRGIYDNIRKIILYLMSDAFEEIIAVVGTILLGLPLPITAVQILWINLISDGFPDLALTVDPKKRGLMRELPRLSKEPLVNSWMKKLIGIVSITGGLAALMLFIYFYTTTGDLILAQSIAFATLGINSLFYVFSIRTLKRPFWKQNPFENKWLNLAVLAGLTLQVLPFVTPFGRKFLGVTHLNISHWLVVFCASAFMFIIIETLKVFVPKKIK